MVIAERPKDRPQLVCSVQAKLPYKPQRNGLPDDTEFARLGNLEEALIGSLTPMGALHLGHITSNGVMTVVFQAPANLPSSVKLKTGLLTRASIELASTRDDAWEFFEQRLAPTDLEAMESNNRKLLRHLASVGDKAELARPVDFAANFPTSEGRDSFLAAVSLMAYRSSAKGNWETLDGPNRFWCEVVTTSDLSAPTMANRCLYLRQEAQRAGGDFDGWSSPVVKG